MELNAAIDTGERPHTSAARAHDRARWLACLASVCLSLLSTTALAQCPFNVSGAGVATAINDGLLLARAAQGSRGAELLNASNSTFATDAVIASIAANELRLDINGNGAFDENDAVIALRFLLGMRKEALVAGLSHVGAVRKSATDVQAYLDGGCLAPLPARKKLSQMPRSNGGVFISILDDVEIDQDATLDWLEIQGSLHCSNRDVALSAKWIIVHGGLLRCGTELNPFAYRLTITLTGTESDDNALGMTMGTKVLGVMHNGALELHGAQQATWTKLDGTAQAGATQIRVLDAAHWRVGDYIAIAPTDFDPMQAEKRRVVAIAGSLITLDTPLAHRHWGQIETLGDTGATMDQRAEVGLLSRSIAVRGARPNGSVFGAHTMVMGDSVARISGVEFSGMGQLGRIGRYPVHFHLLWDEGRHSYVRRSSVHDSVQRGIVVHRSNQVRIQDNVLFDITGHAVFLESAVETKNVFERNLVMQVKMVPKAYRNPNLEFEQCQCFGSQQQSMKNRLTPAGFWISNMHNTFVGNVVAGVQFGYGYWINEAEMSSIRDVPEFFVEGNIFRGLLPIAERRPMIEFRDNVAHSINAINDDGRTTQYASPMAAGLFAEQLAYWPNSPQTVPVIKNFRVWKVAHTGVWAQTFNQDPLPYDQRAHIIDGLIAADNRTALFVEQGAGPTRLRNSVLYGFTNNLTPGRSAPVVDWDWTDYWRSLSNSLENVDIVPVAVSPNSLPINNDITAGTMLSLRANDGRNTPVFLEWQNVKTKGWPTRRP